MRSIRDIALPLAAIAALVACAGGDPPATMCSEVECSAFATCDDTSGLALCACDLGFYDTSGDGTLCTDLDECSSGDADCDDDAICTNLEGGYDCTCADGFSGDGFTCSDIDECDAVAADCDDNAGCENTQGGYECVCNAGFSGDGSTCDDVDECLDGIDECDVNATCLNDFGDYLCSCNTGWDGDGFACGDVDECAEQTATCEGVTVCENTIGAYDCMCGPGYLDEFGDSASCLVRGAGRAVLIGHDYFASNADADKLVGNAVFSANTTDVVSILAYTEATDNSTGGEVANVNAAINARAAALGRTYSLTTFNDYSQLASLLQNYDVLLVYEQELAGVQGNPTMAQVGSNWGVLLLAYVLQGGVIIVTDYAGDTWRILDSSGLMDIGGRTFIFGSPTLTVREPGDPLTAGIAGATYTGQSGTASFQTTDGFPVVESSSGEPVAIIKTFLDGCTVIEDFELSAWPEGPWVSIGDGGSIVDTAAHDFGFGVNNPAWHYTTAITFGPGDVMSLYVRFNTETGRAYIGVNAGDAGAYSLVAAMNTDQLIIQNNAGYGYSQAATVPFTYVVGQWYRLEIEYGASGNVSGRLYEDDSTSPVSVLSHSFGTPFGYGGVAMRAFNDVDIDSIGVCP
jgi:hypothetical protein